MRSLKNKILLKIQLFWCRIQIFFKTRDIKTTAYFKYLYFTTLKFYYWQLDLPHKEIQDSEHIIILRNLLNPLSRLSSNKYTTKKEFSQDLKKANILFTRLLRSF